ncbi:LytR C-terminal domain-containing protein [Demequina sp. NBRC 110053]|uniref:LytR C-terminal domain-containing protein n=1 Tax=Demequina sp. NBRC 110053 TaxID=1570342 RepID=UPI000A00B1E6|nr:LytR C-terminal domain-containing protein [Demequina sp. NBRC 110053]
MAQDYPRDEFDEMAAEGGPVGVHRAPRSWWTRVLPPLVALVVGGLVAWLIATWLWNSGDTPAEPQPTPTVTVTPDAEPTTSPEPSAEPSVEPSEAPSPDPTPTETAEPEPEIIYDAQVHVRNGAGIQGLAGEQEAILTEAGYTNTDANNISASLIPGDENVVLYDGDRLADTAQDVADQLGIDAVEGGGTPGGAEIEVLLASDPG